MGARRNLIEVVVAYGAILAAVWTGGGAKKICIGIAMVSVLALTLLAKRSAGQLGLGLAGLRQSSWIVPLAAVCALLIALAGYRAGTLHGLSTPERSYAALLRYLFFALQQQFAAQSFFFVRLEELLGETKKAVTVTALLFAAAHVPNPVLVPLTLLAGVISSALFRTYRNIYTLALAHALVGLAVAVSVPDEIHRHMRVGIGYLSYR